MILRVYYKPECFAYLPDDTLFYEISCGGGRCAFVGVQALGGAAHLHIIFERFSPAILRVVKDVAWPVVKRVCAERDCHTLVVSKEVTGSDDLKKWKGFIGHLGFKNPQEVHIATMRVEDGN